MDYKPFSSGSNFVDLLQSQQESVFSASQLPFSVTHRSEDCNFGEETPLERRERRKCTPSDDIVLISSWLNTSKDHVVANEQRSGAFWKRIAAYFAASQKVPGCKQRESRCTVSKGGRRSTTSSASSVAPMKLQPGRRPADKMRLMFSKERMRSSTTTIRRSSPLSMHG